MFRLKVLSAPKNSPNPVGTSIEVASGESSIGRLGTNQIVLNSGNVSKRHCVLVVDNTASKVSLRDAGSANGTFVNGELTRERALNIGDKISIGEFVFELKNQNLPQRPSSQNNVLSFPSASAPGNGMNDFNVPMMLDSNPGVGGPLPHAHSHVMPDASVDPDLSAPEEPKNLVGRLMHLLEHRVLPYLYEMNTKHEWRILCGGLIGLFMIGTSLIGIWPLISAHEDEFTHELERKAKMIAIEVAERNSIAVANHQYSLTDVGTFARARSNGVRGVVILDLDLKIIAPHERAGNVLGTGPESQFVNGARRVYSERLDNDRLTGRTKTLENGSIVAVEPIRAFSPKVQKNVIVGIASVVIDGDAAVMSGSEVAMAYGYSLIVSAAFAALIFFLLYRITLRPIEEMNQKIDQSLRGEVVDFRSIMLFEELNPLWDVIDSALKRIPNVDENGASTSSAGMQGAELIVSLKSLVEQASNPSAVFDDSRQIYFLNVPFEEITGIRNDSNVGQMISFAARDQGFISLIEDLFSRIIPGGDSVTESFEFSGVAYKVCGVAFGTNGAPKGYVFSLYKEDGFGA